MTFALEGAQQQKLEVTRGILQTLVYWPRVDGQLVTPSSNAAALPSISIYDAAGSLVVTDEPTVNDDKSLSYDWTPAAAALLAEDYRYDIGFSTEVTISPPVGPDILSFVPHQDRVWFDLVRFPLVCPVDQNALEQIEPSLPKWLSGQGITDAQRYIQRAWSDVVGRIRGAGYRPALITDRSAFVGPATYVALEYAFTALTKAKDDVFDHKRELYRDRAEKAWAQLGPIKFEDSQQSGAPVTKRTPAQPRMRF